MVRINFALTILFPHYTYFLCVLGILRSMDDLFLKDQTQAARRAVELQAANTSKTKEVYDEWLLKKKSEMLKQKQEKVTVNCIYFVRISISQFLFCPIGGD